MISWMQKHRKYLVITIWISTIAFVGAGFVGWGSFDYGSMSGDVAKVGKVKVSKEDYSALYGNMYNYYSKVTGGKLDEATLKTAKSREYRVADSYKSGLASKLCRRERDEGKRRRGCCKNRLNGAFPKKRQIR